jgi:hypothetical protein
MPGTGPPGARPSRRSAVQRQTHAAVTSVRTGVGRGPGEFWQRPAGNGKCRFRTITWHWSQRPSSGGAVHSGPPERSSTGARSAGSRGVAAGRSLILPGRRGKQAWQGPPDPWPDLTWASLLPNVSSCPEKPGSPRGRTDSGATQHSLTEAALRRFTGVGSAR